MDNLQENVLLSCRELTLGYETHAVARNISFDVVRGDYLCIVGENGSGKSTLVKTLLGLQPLLGGTISRSPALKRSPIGYLPQQTPVQRDFPATVEEIVLSGFLAKAGLRPFYTKQEKALAAEKMERLGVTSFRKRCYRELSGGQQQRVLLARALCATDTMLLLDEPVAGLDPKVTQEMYELIEGLNQKDGITILMVSHDIAAVLGYATHILHVMHGSCFFGTTEEYQASEAGKLFAGGDTHAA